MLILFQGCISVYKSTSISLEKASEIERRVKIRNQNGSTLYFDKIIMQDINFYGISKVKPKKVALFKNDIEYVKIKDRTMSTILNIGLPLVLIGVSSLILAQDIFRKSTTIKWY